MRVMVGAVAGNILEVQGQFRSEYKAGPPTKLTIIHD